MPAVLIPAAIDALIIAVMGALVIWALFPVIKSLVSSLPSLPGVGNVFARVATQVANTTVAVLSGWANAGLAPLTDLVNAVAWRFFFLRVAQLDAATATVLGLWRVRYQALPALEARVTSYAAQLYGQAVQFAQALHEAAIAFAQRLYEQAVAYAQALQAAALAYAGQLYAQAIAFAETLYNQAIAYAQALQATAVAYAAQLYAQAIAYAQLVQAVAVGFAEDAFGRSIEYERQLYAEGIKFTEAARIWARDYADARVEALAAVVAASLGAVAVRVTRIERSKCQRFCNPLGDLGEDLEDLSGLFEAGALFALAGAAARDPRGWAGEVAGDLVQPLREAAGAVLGETGVSTRAA